jgi:hypothetical protein
MNNFRSSRPRVFGSPPTRRDLFRAGALGLGLPAYLAYGQKTPPTQRSGISTSFAHASGAVTA